MVAFRKILGGVCHIYDLLIIGSGPAGISAALSAKARNLDFLWFGSRALSPKIAKAGRVMNYPGLPAVTGPEMRDAFLCQIDGLGIGIREERVNSIYDMGGCYTAVVNGKMYDGRTVILAAEVFLCTSYKDRGVRRDNVRHTVGYPSEILGENRASGLVCGGETVEADGIFCLRPCVAPAALLPGLKAEGGHIQVDRQQRTNLPGCFAAGDCTGRPYQYAKAVGEGNVALHSAVEYLKKLEA